MAYTIVNQGSFTSTGAGVKINLPASADYFVVKNLTQLATTQSTGRGVQFEWYGNGLVAADNAIEWKKTNSTDALNMVLVTSGGFTYVTTSPTIEASVTGTAITNANPAVVTMTNSYSNGDTVFLYGTTGMAQIGGMKFTISSVTSGGFTLAGLDASGFAAAATAVTARRTSALAGVEPSVLFITGVTKATQAVVTVSTAHNYVVGQMVEFSIPPSFGMTELDLLSQPATITAVGTYTLTINVDSTAFTTFAFPTSASSPTSQLFALAMPAGQKTAYNATKQTYTGYDFNYVPFHTGQFTPYMYLAGGAQSPAGSSGDIICWQAYKMNTTSYQ